MKNVLNLCILQHYSLFFYFKSSKWDFSFHPQFFFQKKCKKNVEVHCVIGEWIFFFHRLIVCVCGSEEGNITSDDISESRKWRIYLCRDSRHMNRKEEKILFSLNILWRQGSRWRMNKMELNFSERNWCCATGWTKLICIHFFYDSTGIIFEIKDSRILCSLIEPWMVLWGA